MNEESIKKVGRKRIFSDEERIEKNREKSRNAIRFVPPKGYKQDIQKYVNEKENGNINDFFFKLINSYQPFKDFKRNNV